MQNRFSHLARWAGLWVLAGCRGASAPTHSQSHDGKLIMSTRSTTAAAALPLLDMAPFTDTPLTLGYTADRYVGVPGLASFFLVRNRHVVAGPLESPTRCLRRWYETEPDSARIAVLKYQPMQATLNLSLHQGTAFAQVNIHVGVQSTARAIDAALNAAEPVRFVGAADGLHDEPGYTQFVQQLFNVAVDHVGLMQAPATADLHDEPGCVELTCWLTGQLGDELAKVGLSLPPPGQAGSDEAHAALHVDAARVGSETFCRPMFPEDGAVIASSLEAAWQACTDQVGR